MSIAPAILKHYYHDPVVMHGNRDSLRFHFFASFLHILHDGGIDEYEECDPRALRRAEEGVIGNIGESEALAAWPLPTSRSFPAGRGHAAGVQGEPVLVVRAGDRRPGQHHRREAST